MRRAVRNTHVGPIPRAALAFALALSLGTLQACAPDSGRGSASRQARNFYLALNAGDFTNAKAMLTGDADRARLLERFESMGAWGDRLTKNRIVAQLQATEVSVEGPVSHVEILVMFHDGTRRRDSLRLVQSPSGWTVDASSLPGNDGSHGP